MTQESLARPDLVLGTALWGWTIPKARCFALLHHYYQAGFRRVDTATNYPINKQPADFRRAEQILQEWIQAHGVTDLAVMMKVGSINNLRTPEHNLQKSFLLLCLDEYQAIFGPNLHTFMVHWDNREDATAIQDTLAALRIAQQKGLQVGLSGIRHPAIYAALNRNEPLDFQIQIKHNVLHSDYPRYQAFHGRRRFITYGINAGGLKLQTTNYRTDSSLAARGGDIQQRPSILTDLQQLLAEDQATNVQPPVHNFNACGMVFAYNSPDIAGILLGPSRVDQLADTLTFYRALQDHSRQDFYQKLRAIV